MNIGAPTFKGQCKNIRASSYTFVRGIAEFVDNVIMICKNISIIVSITAADGKPSYISVSDDCRKGFEGIMQSGDKNPFNMTHTRKGHGDDEQTSEFGVGMKAAAINLGEVFTVYTRHNDIFYMISFDFREMCKIEDATKSYNPTMFMEISESEYRKHHKYKYGSTIIVKYIRSDIINESDYDKGETILNDLSRIYYRIRNRREISIKFNGNEIMNQYNPLTDEKCKPFNIATLVQYYPSKDKIIAIFQENIPWTSSISAGSKKGIGFWDGKKLFGTKKEITSFMKEHKEEEKKLRFTSTFTLFNDMNYQEDKGLETSIKEYFPRGCIAAYRNLRCYADITTEKKPGNADTVCTPNISKLDYIKRSGNNSYIQNYHEIVWFHKSINSKIGLTFNKHVNSNVTNSYSMLLAKIQQCHEFYFNADKSTPRYKGLVKYAIKQKIIRDESPPVPVPVKVVRKPVRLKRPPCITMMHSSSGRGGGFSPTPPIPEPKPVVEPVRKYRHPDPTMLHLTSGRNGFDPIPLPTPIKKDSTELLIEKYVGEFNMWLKNIPNDIEDDIKEYIGSHLD